MSCSHMGLDVYADQGHPDDGNTLRLVAPAPRNLARHRRRQHGNSHATLRRRIRRCTRLQSSGRPYFREPARHGAQRALVQGQGMLSAGTRTHPTSQCEISMSTSMHSLESFVPSFARW